MIKTNRPVRTLSLMMTSVIALGMLSACQTTGADSSSNTRQAQIDNVIERAANDANAAGSTQDSLLLLEKLYKRNPKDADVATRYARALRDSNRLTRANLVLQPFATTGKPGDNVLAEYASIQTAMGNYGGAEAAARRAVNVNPESGPAYHVLGVALDAQGKHKPAEDAFRQSLEYWKGNPATVLNNLGLNLAAQGFLDDAAETLRKAASTAPNRGEIERNLRIVNALQVSGGQVPSYLKDDEKKAEKPTVDHDAAYIPPAKPHPAPSVNKAPVEKASAPTPSKKPDAKTTTTLNN